MNSGGKTESERKRNGYISGNVVSLYEKESLVDTNTIYTTTSILNVKYSTYITRGYKLCG